MGGGGRAGRPRCREIERRRVDCHPVGGRAGCRFSETEESGMTSPLYADLPGDVSISFEFFPPKTATMEETLWQSIQTLEPLKPRFVSVTYGAGGSTRERTHSTVGRIVRETGLAPAAHLTCVSASRDEIAEVAREYWDAGVRHIVALRGDPPVQGEKFADHPEGYDTAAELHEGLLKVEPLEISAAAYDRKRPRL